MKPGGHVVVLSVGDHAAEAGIAELRMGKVSAEKYGPLKVGPR